MSVFTLYFRTTIRINLVPYLCFLDTMVSGLSLRPVVLAPEQAQEWLESDLSAQRSIEIAQHEGRPVSDFQWYPVGKAVGNVRNQGAELIAPVDESA